MNPSVDSVAEVRGLKPDQQLTAIIICKQRSIDKSVFFFCWGGCKGRVQIGGNGDMRGMGCMMGNSLRTDKLLQRITRRQKWVDL